MLPELQQNRPSTSTPPALATATATHPKGTSAAAKPAIYSPSIGHCHCHPSNATSAAAKPAIYPPGIRHHHCHPPKMMKIMR
jgi:hypothetical protein